MQKQLHADWGFATDGRGSIVVTEQGRSRAVTAIAPDTDKLRELDDQERRAWSAYSERLRDVSGSDYERAEPDRWEELQRELRGVHRRRRSLERTPH
jgi:hypothetical protein